eukprot:Nk52_evm13s355 gene=Nk52_evmTU13s355
MAYLEKGVKRRRRSQLLEVPEQRVRRYSVHNEMYSYDEIDGITNFIKAKLRNEMKPIIGIICGSGLGGLADTVEDQKVLHYNEIPSFPVSTVPGHAGRLVFGKIGGKHVMCMQGRFHFYEGYSMYKVTLPVRVMYLLGIKFLIVTNAAGGLNKDFKTGDVMIIEDHLNIAGLGGNNALFGPNDDRFGPRFPPMSNAYDATFRKLARECAAKLKLEEFIRKGNYTFVSGPAFETPAEARFLKMIGGDTVGMSTVPEVMSAHHCGIKVLGLSLVTNMVVTNIGDKNVANHEEVLETTRHRAEDMQTLVKDIVTTLNPSNFRDDEIEA